jgi:hypothetical protein
LEDDKLNGTFSQQPFCNEKLNINKEMISICCTKPTNASDYIKGLLEGDLQ